MAPSRLHKYFLVLYIVALLFNSQAAALHSVSHIPVLHPASDEFNACGTSLRNNPSHLQGTLPVDNTSHRHNTLCSADMQPGHDALHAHEASHTLQVPHAHSAQHVPHKTHSDTLEDSFKSSRIATGTEAKDPHAAEDGYLCHTCCHHAKFGSVFAHYTPATDIDTATQAIDFTPHNHIVSLSVQAICIRGSPKAI